MARYLDSVCQLCRREGIKLYLKGSRCESPKCAIQRRKAGNNVVVPGMHGFRRGKSSEYGVRLREKQKVKRFYGVLERQFRRYFELASRSPENTGEQLLSIMERRLDNIVHRLGFAQLRRRPANRQSRSCAAQWACLHYQQYPAQEGGCHQGQGAAALRATG